MRDREILHIVLDDYFDKSWKAFRAERQKELKRNNYRLLTVLARMKGAEFVDKLKAIMKKCSQKNYHPWLTITREAKGTALRSKEGLAIYIHQYATDAGIEGEVYVEAKEGRWVKFTYQR